jgi:hypothetical protein
MATRQEVYREIEQAFGEVPTWAKVDEPVEAMADLVEAMLPIQLAELGVPDGGAAAR